MGLDQYLFKTKQTPEQVLSDDFDSDESEQIAYWRKHPNLQGYMKELWKQKYPKREKQLLKVDKDEDVFNLGDVFNCERVFLTLEDLDNWEKAINNKSYPETAGFFFGNNADEDYKEYDLKTIANAKEAIKKGYTVYYDSWW